MNRPRQRFAPPPKPRQAKPEPIPLRYRQLSETLADVLRAFPDLEKFPTPIRDIIVEMYYSLSHYENLAKCVRPQPYISRINDMPYVVYPVVLCSREFGGGKNFTDDERISQMIERWPHMSDKHVLWYFRSELKMRRMNACVCLFRYSPQGCSCPKKLTTIENGHIWIAQDKDEAFHIAELARRGRIKP